MGANAQTSVPAFTAGQVLTAAQVTGINTGIPVFATSTERDAAFGGTGEKTLAEGQFAYLEDTDTVQVYDGTSWNTVGASSVKKVEAFTASGSWTVPAGVTYAIAHIRGGGGGASNDTTADGGDSSVAFAGGTVTDGVTAAGAGGLSGDVSGGMSGDVSGGISSGLSGGLSRGDALATAASARVPSSKGISNEPVRSFMAPR